MKTSLTIEGTPAELARVLTMLGGGVTVTNTIDASAAQQPMTAATNTDDDESGDAEAAPGSVDKSGLPWDDRIHSTPAKLTSKGVWRAKRGVTEQLVQQVEAELRTRGVPAAQPHIQTSPVQHVAQASAAPVPAQQPAPVYQPPAPAPMPQQPEQPAPVYHQQPQPGAPMTMPAGYPAPVPAPQPEQPVYQPQPTAAPAAAPAAGSVDFMQFMQKVAALSQQGLADAAYFQNLTARISQAFQVPMPGGITELQKSQQMVDYAIQIMASEGKWI